MSNADTWDKFINQSIQDWEDTTLGHLFSNRQETNRPNLRLLSVTANDGIVERDSLERRDTSNSDKSKYLRVVPGDIAYNTMRMWQGVSGRSDKEGIVSPAYTVLTPRDAVDSDYAAYLLKLPLLVQRFHQYSQGLVDDTLNLKYQNFSPILVKIPPLKEQQKIAEILTSVDEVIENTQSQINKLEDLKKATMNELLTKGIGHTEFKETEIGRIPRNWRVAYMRDFAKFSGGSAFSESLQGNESGDFPFIKVSDMNHAENTFWIRRSQNWITKQIKESERIKLFPKNTIVFAKVGAALMLNRRRILTQETAIDNNMMGATAKECDHFFLFWLLCSIDFRKIVQDGAVPSINQSQLDELKVAIPELSEQGEIARILKDLHDRSDSLKRKLNLQQYLKSSLMQDLLTGKVRVTVN
jgi:type I restriction enzyme, S subunit